MNTPYQMPLAALPQGPFERQWVCDAAMFADADGAAADVRDASVEVSLKGEHKADDYRMLFTLKGWVTVDCDRCLGELKVPIDAEYATTLRYGDAHDESDERVTILAPQETVINVEPWIRDTILLALPSRRVHPDGECNEEMLQYITGSDLDE